MAEIEKKDWDSLKQDSYRAMLNSEIQASAAREQALKYTQNALNQQGLGNQGISESARVGIHGNYANANASAMDTYRKELLGHNNEQLAYQKQEYDKNFDSLTSLLQSAYTYDEEGNATLTDWAGYLRALKNYGVDTTNIDDVDWTNAELNDNAINFLKSQYQTALNERKQQVAKAQEEENNKRFEEELHAKAQALYKKEMQKFKEKEGKTTTASEGKEEIKEKLNKLNTNNSLGLSEAQINQAINEIYTFRNTRYINDEEIIEYLKLLKNKFKK